MNEYRGGGKAIDADPDLTPKAFEPLGNLVIIQLVPQTKSPGGISLPETVQEIDQEDVLECRRAWVVAHGCQCRYVRRGDLIMPNGPVGKFMHNGKRLAAINEDKIIGIERAADGKIPAFEVIDWKEQIVEREGEGSWDERRHDGDDRKRPRNPGEAEAALGSING